VDEETALKKARYLVLRLLTYRARSSKEVSDYLSRKGFTEDLIKVVIGEMTAYGYLNDHKFAQDFIAYRKIRGNGLKKVRYELALKGLDRQIVDDLVEEQFDEEEDLIRIERLLLKRSPIGETIDDRWLNRQVAFLRRRGFQDNLIMNALKRFQGKDLGKDLNLSE
jgi:regulatory protein